MLSIQELWNLPLAELEAELINARRKFYALKMGVKTGKVKAIHELKESKVYVARILTIMTHLKNEAIVKADEKKEA